LQLLSGGTFTVGAAVVATGTSVAATGALVAGTGASVAGAPQAVKSMAARITTLAMDHKTRCSFIFLLLKFGSDLDFLGT
jgi:hypothetical protein